MNTVFLLVLLVAREVNSREDCRILWLVWRDVIADHSLCTDLILHRCIHQRLPLSAGLLGLCVGLSVSPIWLVLREMLSSKWRPFGMRWEVSTLCNQQCSVKIIRLNSHPQQLAYPALTCPAFSAVSSKAKSLPSKS